MKTILVVDDRPANIALLEDILNSAGYNVISAQDGNQGLEQVKTHLPDLDERRYLKEHVNWLTQALEDKLVALEKVMQQNAVLLKDSKRHEAELEKSLSELQNTQSYLVQSERLSAVGQLVAGVAHGLNNP